MGDPRVGGVSRGWLPLAEAALPSPGVWAAAGRGPGEPDHPVLFSINVLVVLHVETAPLDRLGGSWHTPGSRESSAHPWAPHWALGMALAGHPTLCVPPCCPQRGLREVLSTPMRTHWPAAPWLLPGVWARVLEQLFAKALPLGYCSDLGERGCFRSYGGSAEMLRYGSNIGVEP